MSKISLTDVANINNPTSVAAAVNGNNTIIEQAFDNTLSRDGTSPNQMGSVLDMNSNRIINLAAPQSPSDAARLADISNGVTIPDGSVTYSKLDADVKARISANGGTGGIADGSVTTSKIADTAVTYSKLSADVQSQITQGGSPNIPAISKAINFRQKKFALIDYGYVGNSRASADATTNASAFDAAFAGINNSYAGGTIVLPTDDVYINRPVGGTLNNSCFLEGNGGRSRLHFVDSTANGPFLSLLSQAGSDTQISLENFDIQADALSNVSNGALIRVRSDGFLKRPSIDNMHITGSPTAKPNVYLLIYNANETVISRVVIESRSGLTYPTTGTGIIFIADAPAYDTTVRDCEVSQVGTAFYGQGNPVAHSSQGNWESLWMYGNKVIECNIGLSFNGQDYQPPGGGWFGGHINAAQYCMVFNNYSYFTIHGAQMFLNIDSPQTIGATLQFQNCIGCSVMGSNFGFIAATGGTRHDNVPCVVFDVNSYGNQAIGNTFQLNTIGSSTCFINQGTGTNRAGMNQRFGGGNGSMLGSNMVDMGYNTATNQ